MAKKSINLFFGLILSFMTVFSATVAKAEKTAALDDAQKKNVIQQIEKAWNEYQNYRSSTYDPKVRALESFSYTYTLSDAGAQKAYNDYIMSYGYSGGYGTASATKTLEDFKNETHNGNCRYVGGLFGGVESELDDKKLVKWTSSQKDVIKKNNISIPTDKIMYKYFDAEANQSQASYEQNPAQGINQCVKMGEELDDIVATMRRQIGTIQGLLETLNPNNYINIQCAADVKEGEDCPQGSEIYTAINEDGEATSGASEGCVPLPVKLAEIKTCILCPLFAIILRTDQTVATKSFSALAGGFRNVIIIVMALYIAWQTLITVSAFTKQDAPKYLGSLMVQGFKVFVAALLLSNSSWIYHYVINPLLQAGLEFGLSLLFKEDILTQFNTLALDEAGGMPSGVISEDLLGKVMASIKLFNKIAAEMPAIGSSLMCVSWHAAAKILPDFSMLIEGALIFGFGWAIVLAASFYLLDSAVRFGIFCTLLPFLIASWPFKVTAKYTKTGWDIFMNCFFNFVMMGLVIGLNSELISYALTGGRGGKDALIAAINGNNVEDLKELMDISGTDFLVLVASCLFAFKLVGQINALATELAGGGGSTGIGNKIGGLAAQAGKKAVGTAAKAGKAAGGFAYEASGAKGKVQGAKDKVAGKLGKTGAKIGLGPKASATGSGGGGNNGGGGGDSGGDDAGGDSGGGEGS